MNEGRLYGLTKIQSVTDTPPEGVAHSLQRKPARQSPTPPGPGRNDLFHARVPRSFVRAVFEVMADTPQHTYQILTKRSRRLRHVARELTWPPNVWMGVSVETPAQLYRVEDLRTVPAAVRFLSCEPLLGPIGDLNLAGSGWVIAGGESGRGHRPVAAEWVRQLRDACERQSVPFFFKQWGGVQKSKYGRELAGETFDEFPATVSKDRVPPIAWRRGIVEEFNNEINSNLRCA